MRLARSSTDLLGMLERIYGQRDDFAAFSAALVDVLRSSWDARPEPLKWLDLARDLEPDWFQRSDRIGYVFYVDRFNRDLLGVLDKLDWLQELGVTYVHLMPCLRPRPGDNDGGYSVMDYREVNPAYGTMVDLERVAAELRVRGMSLCIDVVLNHTAKEHRWAEQARRGVEPYTDYYLMFDDGAIPAAYEESLVEIFPDQAPGNFSYYPELDKWVWTTFNEHQWDLNWANPWVFLEMVRVVLSLANHGADVVRLDAVAFMWKRLGTRCQSEPEVHVLLHALRAATRIAAPAVIHLAEAIVGPAEMIPYLGAGEHAGREGNLAYHNSLMVQFWSALASRDTRLMTHVLRTHFPPVLSNATYATYLRCHDDIGWAITDEDAAAVGLSAPLHRAFLAEYYNGAFPGSDARGTPFQVDPHTGDMRTNGTTASLAGLEAATEDDDEGRRNHAVDRILLGHALVASYGGIPLIYSGDEIALLNDYGQLTVPGQTGDGRWIHRPPMDWDRARRAEAGTGPEGEVLKGLRHIMARRRATPELHASNPTIVLETGQIELFAFARQAPTGPIVCLYNFTERWIRVGRSWIEANGVSRYHDQLSDREVELHDGHLELPPYGRVWLR